MLVEQLVAQGVRNLADLQWRPALGLNALVGPNGAGKSSVLEALYLLGTGRSLRGAGLDAVINYDASRLLVQGRIRDSSAAAGPVQQRQLGLARERNGRLELRCDGENLASTSGLAALFPQQLVTPDSISLLSAGPGTRRRFLDWGVFHVEHGCMVAVRGYRRALAQRNAVLRQQGGDAALDPWEQELHRWGTALADWRQRWLDQYLPVFRAVLDELAPLDLEVRLFAGWDRDRSLLEALAVQRHKDRKRGFTQVGPHRADLRLRMASGPEAGRPALDVLSRGQQKVVACALLAAQGRLLRQQVGRQCLFLVDDLAAELDAGHQQRLVSLLLSEHQQVVMTAVQDSVVAQLSGQHALSVFHVEHGRVSPAADG